ncbi:MAG: lysophospholipid acyltransferase family protein [Phototrophicaceae bacterium]
MTALDRHTLDAETRAYLERQPTFDVNRRWLKRLLKPIAFDLLWDVTVSGVERVPSTGGVILMMNHISAIDPILCVGAVDQRFVIPMSKVENVEHPVKGLFLRMWGVYTVDRDGVDRRALTSSIALLQHGQAILIAPEGTRHPEGLAAAKDGLTYIATKSDAVVVPAAVSYAQEWYGSLKRFRRHAVSVRFGRPFRFKTGGRARIPRDEIAQMTQESMYQLALAVQDERARGVYADLALATTETLAFL